MSKDKPKPTRLVCLTNDNTDDAIVIRDLDDMGGVFCVVEFSDDASSHKRDFNTALRVAQEIVHRWNSYQDMKKSQFTKVTR